MSFLHLRQHSFVHRSRLNQPMNLTTQPTSEGETRMWVEGAVIMEFGEAIKNPAYRIFQTEYSGCQAM